MDDVTVFSDPPLGTDYRHVEEYAVDVHSVICNEAGDLNCRIHGIPYGDPRPDRPIDMHADDIDEIYIESSVLPDDRYQTLGETGFIWTEATAPPITDDLPDCQVRHSTQTDSTALICYGTD